MTANSFPQEFHQGRSCKDETSDLPVGLWVEREVEFSKTSEATQSKVRVTWMHGPVALRRWGRRKELPKDCN